MKISIILTTLLSTFATNDPNLCDFVYRDVDGSPYTDTVGQTLARYCEWRGPDAPVYDASVCCELEDDAAACRPVDAAESCVAGERYYCEYGEPVAGGGVACYQPFPSMCDAGLCVRAPEGLVGLAHYVVCCAPGGVCYSVEPGHASDCNGDFMACSYGFTNDDGTVECFYG
ncbi:hypothetical protein ENSA5_09450 [Enhygromyxa salina]|uniref:Uncharacterized protein n=1 Tax=Enhygromyxa salina TaxID=215803 RepID=A0A2S9YH08_9BACT|nr:hypothetical protein [Enhygromyxa salina]PRQ04296.1 hypothetical protein ENSA5_09450 [Enhygromyxa salina]